MNDIQITSLEALATKVHPNLGARQALVLQYLRSAGAHTNAEISRELNKPINEITPRTHELRKMGLVIEAGKRLCAVGKPRSRMGRKVLRPSRRVPTEGSREAKARANQFIRNMKKPKKPTMDSELIRIQGILGLAVELNDRMWKLKRDHGEEGYKRSVVYISSRVGWVFRRFDPPVQ